MRSAAIIQSNYIPWKGYFDIIRQVDVFVIYDVAIYTARSWRNRNLIKTPKGLQWLVIPVHHDYQHPLRICDTRAVDGHWRKKHWKNLHQHYSASPHFKECCEWLEPLYLGDDEDNLSNINVTFLEAVNRYLGISTPLERLSDYTLTGDREADLITVCQRYGAKRYLSGPAAKQFLRPEAFTAQGIELCWMHYEGYPEYPQSHPPFVHEVSILDLLFSTGDKAGFYSQRQKP